MSEEKKVSEEKKDVAVSEKTDETDITFILPDLVSQCKFPVRYHPLGDEVAKESAEWLDANCPNLNLRQRDAMYGLQGGVLAALCYTTGPRDRLRVIADYINYLFHL
jgi:alpha-muurolene/germacrene-A/gamma-muurolene synthase